MATNKLARNTNKSIDSNTTERLLALLGRELRRYDAEEVVSGLLELADELGVEDVGARPAARRPRKRAGKIAENIATDLVRLGHAVAVESFLDDLFLARQRAQFDRAQAALERALTAVDGYQRPRLIDAIEQDVAILVERGRMFPLVHVLEHAGYRCIWNGVSCKELGDAAVALARVLPMDRLRELAGGAALVTRDVSGGSWDLCERASEFAASEAA